MRQCCREHFRLEFKACVKASPEDVPEAPGAVIEEGGIQPALVNPARYRYDYYPIFADLACVRTPDEDPPGYMLDDPGSFFFVTYGDCCAASYDLEYGECLDRSREAARGMPLVSDEAAEETAAPPRVEVEFGGRLYFRNAFVPGGTPANLRIVREAVLHAVRTAALEGYMVVRLVGLDFDGVDLRGLDAALTGSGRREEDGRRQLAPAAPPRRLARMQLFRFSFEVCPVHSRAVGRTLRALTLSRSSRQVSLPCADPCADPATAGRAASFDVAGQFEEAVEDGTLFDRLRQDIGGMGLVGPFFSATLDEGHLTYEGAKLDARYTRAPTSAPSWGMPFYPDVDEMKCVRDGRQPKFQTNLYDSREECVSDRVCVS